MSQRIKRSALLLIVVMAIVVFVKMIPGAAWWSCVIPIVALGVWVGLKKWTVAGLGIGFLAGFLLWPGAILFFHWRYQGGLLPRLGLAGMVIFLLAAGLTGGLLCGLALYTGKTIATGKSNEPALPD